jgi:hypothetical protein
MSISVILLGLVFCDAAYAGGGTGEKFTLSISVRHDATSSELDEWRDAFQQASELLFDATDGQHQFGTIIVCNQSYAGRGADIHLFEEDGRSYTSLPLPGLGLPVSHMFLYGDEKEKPFVIVHEFGHYGYGLYDEYSGPSGDAECVESPANATASIMEGGWWQAPGVDGGDGYIREISEFCVPSNHDPDHNTEQEDENGESCWETMNHYYPDLVMPAGLPQEGPTSGGDDIVWLELEPETRLVLCIDHSGSMDSPSWKMDFAKLAAQLFVDLAEIGDKVGVVSYASEVDVDFPLTEVVSGVTKEDAKVAIEAIFPSGETAMGLGLKTALGQLTSQGDTACQQAIVLLSNGFQNTGLHPYDVVPSIQREMTRVFTVGVGDSVDEVLLRTIAGQTNGKYFRVRHPRDALDAFGILAVDVKDGGLITRDPSLISEGERVERHVPIDNTDEGAVFEASWEGSDLDLTLVKPDGSLVDSTVAASDPDIEYVTTSHYEFYRVASPDEGEWTLVTEGIDVEGQIPFTNKVLARNRRIYFDVVTDKDQYEYPEEVLVRAQVLFGVPLTGVEVFGQVVRPDESTVPIMLFDDGLSSHGDRFADDGLYSNFFSDFNEDGSYSFELIVRNTDGGIIDGGEPLRPDSLGGPEVDPPPTPGPFRRWANTTVVVSGVVASLDAGIDIDPNTLNLWSKGSWITCYIELAAGYNVGDIDISSLLLNGALPAELSPYEVGDHDGDEVPDLMVKFDRQEAQSLLMPGDSIEIEVTGQVMGESFAGSDFIRVIEGGPNSGGLVPEGLPSTFVMMQNFPNPFTSMTHVSYALPRTSQVSLKVYDASGQLVYTLVDQIVEPGYHTAEWHGKNEAGYDAPSGIYFCRIRAHTGLGTHDFTSTKKMILLR